MTTARPAAMQRVQRTLQRRGWNLWLRGKFLLFQRRRHNRAVLEQVAGRPVLVLPEVLNPALFFTGRWLATLLDDPSGPAGARLIPAGSAVLDMGCGSGVVALAAAKQARRVVSVDINPAAVRCTRINALLNSVDDRVEAREGDLFAPLANERFDVIVFNPPYFPGRPRNTFERALRSEGLAERFAAGLGDHLTGQGYALLLLSSVGDEAGWLAPLARRGFSAQVVAAQTVAGERLTLHRIG